jgi:hypothetical protein
MLRRLIRSMDFVALLGVLAAVCVVAVHEWL